MDFNQPLVSVIIPTYNRPYSLKKTVISIFNQTYQNFEIVIIDDSANDQTEKIVKAFKDKRIRYFYSRERTNISKARNRGVKESNLNSKYIAFLDDDCEWLPHYLDKTLTLLEKNKEIIGVIPEFGHKIIDTGKFFKTVEVKECWNTLVGNGSILRKSLFLKENFWFDEKLSKLEDWDFGIRILRTHKLASISEVLQIFYHKFYSNQNSLSGTPTSLELLDYFFQKHHHYFLTLRGKALSFFYYTLGKLYCRNGDIKKGRSLFLKSFLNSLSPAPLAYYLFWLFPPIAKRVYVRRILTSLYFKIKKIIRKIQCRIKP